jgi:hypothetical protein
MLKIKGGRKKESRKEQRKEEKCVTETKPYVT